MIINVAYILYEQYVHTFVYIFLTVYYFSVYTYNYIRKYKDKNKTLFLYKILNSQNKSSTIVSHFRVIQWFESNLQAR